MKFKKDEEGKLVLDDAGDPIAIDQEGNAIPLDKVVSVAKHERITSERDDYKAQVDALNSQIAELQKSSGDAEALKTKVAELTEKAASDAVDFKARMSAKDKEYALDTALLASGCVDVKAARAHVDFDGLTVADGKLSGFDADAFKKDRPYLFNPATKVSTAAVSSGTAEGDADMAAARQAAGLPPKA